VSRFDFDWDGATDLDIGRGLRNMEVCVTGRKGQAALRALEAALVALPRPRLVAGQLVTAEGDVCAVGALKAHALATHTLKAPVADAIKLMVDTYAAWFDDEELFEEWEDETIIAAVGCRMTPALAELVGEANDDPWPGPETPEQRYTRMLRWVRARIVPDA
jgi:hypothetical protein